MAVPEAGPVIERIYVALLDEGTQVYRPVQAVRQGDGVYRILSVNQDAEGEHWQFSTGDSVRCRLHSSADGTSGLVAVERVDGVA